MRPAEVSSTLKANFGSLFAPWLWNGPLRRAATVPTPALAPRGSIRTLASTVAERILPRLANVELSSELTSELRSPLTGFALLVVPTATRRDQSG